jgi:hypothetical protein
MGTWPQRQKEFWWEREWRHVGDLDLPNEYRGVLWLCPEGEELVGPDGESLEPRIDPRWGLEQIIAHLAGFAVEDVTPFAPHQDPPDEEWLAAFINPNAPF